LAFIIFVMVRQINRLKADQPVDVTPEKAPETPEDVLLLREIRDSLKPKS
jgi:large conductance mechanosensitive channel